MLGFKSSLCIIDTSPLSDICDLQIYSASLWFIFIHFSVLNKDLLTFIKSNLSIFALMNHILVSALGIFCLTLDTKDFLQINFLFIYLFLFDFIFPYGSAIAPLPLVQKTIFAI